MVNLDSLIHLITNGSVICLIIYHKLQGNLHYTRSARLTVSSIYLN